MEISVKRLGLAAYIKMNGGVFKSHGPEDGQKGKNAFFFETDKPLRQWEVEYANSCCALHDAEVMNLRKFMK